MVNPEASTRLPAFDERLEAVSELSYSATNLAGDHGGEIILAQENKVTDFVLAKYLNLI